MHPSSIWVLSRCNLFKFFIPSMYLIPALVILVSLRLRILTFLSDCIGFRPSSLIFAMTPSDKVYRKLSLSWGVVPVRVRRFKSTDQMLKFCKKFLIDNHITKKEEQFIMTAGIPVGVTGTTNMIKIETI